ncbi:MAG: hypothetical protein ABSC11_12650 [Smithella sp.]|jgi:hypothetical protein
MKKSILEIYALAICFATIVCLLIFSGLAIQNAIRIIYPEFTIGSNEYNRHQNNDAFWGKGVVHTNAVTKQEITRPPEQELTNQRLESYQQTLKSERRTALQSLTNDTIVIILSIIFFIVHWRIARRARETNIST